MIAINKLLVMVFLVVFLCIDISPGLAQSNWQQQQWQQQQRQQEMLRQQQLQQQRMMEQQRQQQQIQKQQAQQRQMQQRQIQQQQGSSGLRQNSANRGFPAKNQTQETPNRPRIVIKTPQSTTNSLKNSTNLSSRAQQAKQTATDLADKQKMKERRLLIKKNKEERRLADLRKKEKERLDREKEVIYIGKESDLENIPREQTLLPKLSPSFGTPKENWKRNSSILRKEIRDGKVIIDASKHRENSDPDPTTERPDRKIGQSFLGAERNLMDNKGYKINADTGVYEKK